MADIIQLLPDAIANQIAAGEVIQRPASVVKELMENAIDAGADNVKLIIKDSGKALIQVIDNGCGMSETDARMSLERHATSKIRQSQDLFAIRTMGFRGEAMASIAAVAQLEMRTRRHADELGTRLLVEGSEVKVQEACQCSAGTSISVKHLFYNVPARRNFLKSNSVEMRHILDEFQRVAMANPDIFFSLHHNNTEVFRLPTGNLRQRVVGIFGQAYNRRLVPVAEETAVVKISGFVGKPEFSKKSRGEQYFFVNNRFIKSTYLNHAVTTAYEESEVMPKDAYPLYILFIDMDPSRIDINVHPTKQEIKFEDERLVYTTLKVAVRHALGQHGIMPTLDFDQEGSFSLNRMPAPPRQSPTISSYHESQADRSPAAGGATPRESQARAGRNLKHWQKLYEGLADVDITAIPEETLAPTTAVTIESEWSNNDSAVREEKTPYQIHNTYIISHIKSGFLLIDQQAAHERILYEQYLAALSQQEAVSQQQLFPRTLTLTPADATLLEEMLPQLNLLGFDIKELGQHTFAVNGVPAEVAGRQNEEKVIEQLLDRYRENLELKLDARDNVARAMAVSAAIRRGQGLSTMEMRSLIDRLFACQAPFRSPSGRHCFLTFELDDLVRRFDS